MMAKYNENLPLQKEKKEERRWVRNESGRDGRLGCITVLLNLSHKIHEIYTL